MRDLQEVKRLIETARLELDKEQENGDMEARYQKSLALDELIEEYLAVKESSTSHH